MNVVKNIKFNKQYNYEPHKNHIKESNWDNRFHLGKLPKYDAFTDINYITMRQMKEFIRQSDLNNKKRVDNIDSYVKKHKNILISSNDNDSLNENFNIITSLWEDLCVNYSYRYIFERIANELTEDMKKDLFEHEIQGMRKFSEKLGKLGKDIQSRESLINNLRYYNDILMTESLNESILNDLTVNFKNLRIVSINIVNHFIKLRETLAYSLLCGKYNFDKLKQNFSYDKNYLIKVIL